jgi:putative SOS response-associated peptidase YedK
MCSEYESNRRRRRAPDGVKGDFFGEVALTPQLKIRKNSEASILAVDSDGKTRIESAFWGLMRRDFARKNKQVYKPHINARSETAADKPSFRDAVTTGRCLIPATAFYEPKLDSARRFVSLHRFFLNEEDPFWIAGLWEHWTPEDTAAEMEFAFAAPSAEARFVMLTCAPNKTVAKVHSRMPAILLEDQLRPWLAGTLHPAELGAFPGDLIDENVTDQGG